MVEWADYSWLGLKKEIRMVKLRLAYIDTPELRHKQPGALQAQDLLESWLKGKYVIVEYEQLPGGNPRKGDYNRVLAVVHLPRMFLPNMNINRELLKKGLARLHKNPDNITPHHRKSLARAERSARRRRLGIWKTAYLRENNSSHILLYITIGIALGILIAMIFS